MEPGIGRLGCTGLIDAPSSVANLSDVVKAVVVSGAHTIGESFSTVGKVVGILLLVVIFGWLRQRMLNQGNRGEPRVKPWEKQD